MDVITAPAKLNLYLSVKGTTPDRYHLLEMINVSITLADRLSISFDESGSGFALQCVGEDRGVSGEDLSDPKSNILFKTYRLFCDTFGVSCALSVKLEKTIPVGAGLGGGSSDAAALLMYLAKRMGSMSEPFHANQKLLQCAQALGADVPYFLAQQSCIVRGIGEILEPVTISALASYEAIILSPPVQLSTKAVFERFDSEFLSPTVSTSLSRSKLETTRDLSSFIQNDLAPAAIAQAPLIGEILSACREKGCISGLTGSGAAMFVLVHKAHMRTAESVHEIAQRYSCRLFTAQFL